MRDPTIKDMLRARHQIFGFTWEEYQRAKQRALALGMVIGGAISVITMTIYLTLI